MKFVELSETEFGQAEFKCRSFLQSVEMYRRLQGINREAYLVGVKDGDGKVVAAGLVMGRPWHFKKRVYRVPGGWLVDYRRSDRKKILQVLTAGAKKFCAEKGGAMLEIAPNIVSQWRDSDNNVVAGENNLAVKQDLEDLGYKYLGEYDQTKWTYVKDLVGQPYEDMLMDFRTTHRQLIHKAEREGVRVRELAENELDIMKRIAEEAGERHGFEDPDIEYYQSMKKYFGDKVKFLVAELPKESLKEADKVEFAQEGDYIPLAASMFVKYGDEMVYLYSGSRRKLQKYNGTYAIQWQMIQEAQNAGLKKYNFYGIKPEKDNGVYKFKQGFRGRVEELLGAFALPIGAIGKAYVSKMEVREFGVIK